MSKSVYPGEKYLMTGGVWLSPMSLRKRCDMIKTRGRLQLLLGTAVGSFLSSSRKHAGYGFNNTAFINSKSGWWPSTYSASVSCDVGGSEWLEMFALWLGGRGMANNEPVKWRHLASSRFNSEFEKLHTIILALDWKEMKDRFQNLLQHPPNKITNFLRFFVGAILPRR